MNNEAINEFINVSIEYGKGLDEGNTRVINKNSEKLTKIENAWKAEKYANLEQFEQLLEHENEYVRLEAAYILLKIAPERARQVLQEVSQIPKGMASFQAWVVLKELEKGNL